MIKKEELFALIKSLTRSEKRHFSLFCDREASGKNYKRLFEAIDRQNDYNENELKQLFKDERFIGQLHVTKNYLRKLILKSLRNYHSNLSKDAELKDILRNIEILYHKELYQLCRVELKRAVFLAERFELTTGLVETLSWKRKLDQATSPHNYDAFKEAVLGQEKAISRLINTNDYWKLSIDATTGGVSPATEPDINYVLLEDPDNALTLESKILHYNTAYFWKLRQGKNEEAENQLYELIGILKNYYPHRMKEEPGLYISCVNNLVSYLVFTRQYDKALDTIQKSKPMFNDNYTLSNKTLLRQMLRTFNIELEIYRDTKTFMKHSTFIDETETLISKHQEKMPKEYLVSFWFQLANIHFMKKDHSRSLFWINQMLNTNFKDVRPDLKIQVQMLNLMVHLEQQNIFVLRYFVDSTKRFMKKVKQVQTFESALLHFFIKIGKTPLLEYKEAFRQLKHQLFPKDQPSLIPEDMQGYIDYKEWIDGKLG